MTTLASYIVRLGLSVTIVRASFSDRQSPLTSAGHATSAFEPLDNFIGVIRKSVL